ncbi:hypothetical protein N7492_009268 [Penicillium capsulatum]|uniref:Zn(2)-C6 fungal-type domain-containing protein n=1 Tax=Penicillium capsulatum TaxID=69766 RepID=A0A9W9HUJ6_9EURO|nr:hypothetical protein N7492_009268 [Penicillium capsulatum]KAJ6106662.1 hypothetical protein N7512_010179 [Penicillium capsulatum]
MDPFHASSEPNARKRRRPALSCEQCRRRKVRCDREMPCGPCTKSQPQLTCEYVHEGKAALDARRDVSSGNDEPASCVGDATRIAELERTIQGLQGRLQSLEQIVQAPGASRLGLESPTDDNAHRPGNVSHGLDSQFAPGRPRPDSRTGQPEPPQTLIPPLVPRLKGTDEKARLFGTTHWAIVFQQFRLLRQVRSTASYTDGAQNDISKLLKEIRSLRRSIKGRQTPALADPAPGLLNDVPPRVLCDKLVQDYLRTLGLIYRVLHVPTFYQEYERFWDNPGASSTGFVMKLLLMLAIGSIFHCRPGPSNELALPIRKWIYAAQWWISGPFEKETNNLGGLQVYCLLLICRQGHAIEKESNWTSAGTLLRLAINQGLHRDPANFPSLSVFDAEMRRRIWAAVLELNVQLAIDAAMPPLLALEDFDTRPPSNLNDKDFDRTTSSVPQSKSMDDYTDSSLQILLSGSFPTRLRITRSINECSRAQAYETALRLGSELSTACREMTLIFQKFFSATTSHSTFPPTAFHHRLMDTLLRRFLLNLYRPFTVEAVKDPRFYLSRKLSVDSALIMTSYGDLPSSQRPEDQTSLQDFQRLAFSGAGLFKCHLSLDVMIVIALELITQVEETAADPPGSDLLPLNPADQIAQAARAPLVQALDRTKEHLYDSLVAGIPSMKRYCLLGGILAQVQSIPREEQAAWKRIQAAFMESMKTCRSLLQQYISADDASLNTPADGSTGGSTGWTSESAIGSSLESDYALPILGLDDLDFWDIPAFVDTSTFDPAQLQS